MSKVGQPLKTTPSIELKPNLQPLSIPELLDRSIRLYRKNFLMFIGIVAVFQLPLTIATEAPTLFAIYATETATFSTASNVAAFTSCLSVVFSIAEFILIGGYVSAAMAYATAASYLGQPISILESYRQSRAFVGKLLSARILSVIYTVGLLIWFLVPIVGWFTGVGILFFYSSAITPLIASLVVLERQQSSGSIRRAWDITRRRFWPVAGFVIVLSLFSQLAITGPTTLLSIFLEYLFTGPLGSLSTDMFAARSIIQSLVSLLFSLLYSPFYYVSIVLLYFDLRVRTEGLDLVLATSSESEILQKLTDAPEPERGNLANRGELGQFVLLSVIGVIFVGLFYLLFGRLTPAIMGALGQ